MRIHRDLAGWGVLIATLPRLPLAWAMGWTPLEFFAATPDEAARPQAVL